MITTIQNKENVIKLNAVRTRVQVWPNLLNLKDLVNLFLANPNIVSLLNFKNLASLKSLYILLLIAFLTANVMQAQPDSARKVNRPFPRAQLTPNPKLADTTFLEYFYAFDFKTRYGITDTLLENFHQYDPTRQQSFHNYLHLGELGAVHRSYAYQPLVRRGFDVGLHNWDLYRFAPNYIRFFHTSHPYTHTYYSQASAQEDISFMATFTNKIGERGNYSMDFRRISQQGLYQNQKSRHTNLVVNGWLKSKKGNYTGLFSWLHNINEQQNNGGIQNESDLTQGVFGVRSAVAVNLTTSASEMREDRVTYTQYFNILRQVPKQKLSDSTTAPLRDSKTFKESRLSASHQLEYQKWSFKFYDTSPASDSSFYGNFQTSQLGIRNFIAYNRVRNVAKLRLNYKGALEAGLIHDIYFLKQEPTDTVLNNLFLVGDWDLQLDQKQRYGLNVKAHFGLLDNGADYLLKGNLYLDFNQLGKLTLSAQSQGYNPNLLQTRLYVSQNQVWNNNFSKTIENSLSATYQWNQYLKAMGRLTVLNNMIYYDSLAIPQQITTPVTIGQLMVQANFKFGTFHIDNDVVLQQVTDNILRFPTLVSRHSLYLQGKIFGKNMFAKFGVDLRYHTGYLADNYQPVIGQFYPQNTLTIEHLPILDAFVSFKVRTFRAFVKVENINQWVLKDIYYTAPRYPVRDRTFRFGISWRFKDSMEPVIQRQNQNNQ